MLNNSLTEEWNNGGCSIYKKVLDSGGYVAIGGTVNRLIFKGDRKWYEVT